MIQATGIARGLALSFVFLLAGGWAVASPILTFDQQNTVGTDTNFPSLAGVGQSFTPTLSSIDAAEFSFRAEGATLTLGVYAGAGLGGLLLGQSAPLSITTAGFQTVHFDLLSAIALTPGDIYTLFVTNTSGSFGQQFSFSNPYAGGIAFDAGGGAAASVDLVFAEGLHAMQVPEPGSLPLVGLAGLGALVASRRRHHA